MIKIICLGLIGLFFSIISIGCSLNEGTEKLYRQENVLKVDMILPEKIDPGEVLDIQALLSQFDGEVPELEHIEFFIWKNGEEQKKQYFLEHVDAGNGIYRVTTIIEDKGLYFVKLVANTSESKVMPTKQFTVGSLSELDSDSLPKKSNEQHHEGHH